jgi:hypothetical protein
MPKNKKSVEEINKILKELRELKVYDNELYKKKVSLLKKEDSDTYFKIIILLNMEGNAQYSSSASGKCVKYMSLHLPKKMLKKPIAQILSQ